MKIIALVAMLSLIATTAYAESSSCASQASDQKLSGPLLESFMRKCAKDFCIASAKEQSLTGLAQASFITKCMRDILEGT